jgi:hypothetical protein
MSTLVAEKLPSTPSRNFGEILLAFFHPVARAAASDVIGFFLSVAAGAVSEPGRGALHDGTAQDARQRHQTLGNQRHPRA